LGGKHNASSSVDSTALKLAPANSILIRPHDTQILGFEYQAIFRPEHLAEYIFTADSIHRERYPPVPLQRKKGTLSLHLRWGHPQQDFRPARKLEVLLLGGHHSRRRTLVDDPIQLEPIDTYRSA
jgi:hypothetical protein